jgi:hypothetical protein
VVTGGLGDGSVSIDEVSKKKFHKNKKYAVTMYKPPLLNNSTTEYCLPDSKKITDLENEEIAKIEG